MSEMREIFLEKALKPEKALEIIQKEFSQALLKSEIVDNEIVVELKPEYILDFARLLKENENFYFDFLRCLCGVDYPDKLMVVYHLYSTTFLYRMVIKVPLPKENPSLSSVTSVWKTANWHERETYEMFGINFEGHPDLRIILLPEDFEGYPLRKDFKLIKTPEGKKPKVKKEESE